MKPLCLLLTAFLIFLTSIALKAQDASADKNSKSDLVLEIPKADLNKILPPLKLKLKEIQNVSFEGYCDSRKLLFLHIDQEAFLPVLNVMKDFNLIYYIKQNTSVEQAKKVCMSESEIKSSFNIE